MRQLYPEPEFVTAHTTGVSAIPAAYQPREMLSRAYTPVSQEVLSWLLFWPLLTLIARQAVYFSGPARTAEAFQNGAAMAGRSGAPYHFYLDLLFLLWFLLAWYWPLG